MAIFSSLADRLQETFKKLTGKGKLSEADINEAMREVRLALLEADVNYKVVKDFIATVKARSVGTEVLESLSPGQQVVKIVHEELINIMGPEQAKIAISPKPPTIIMMVGLQGTGKTTSAAKIAGYFKKQGRRPLLVACDVYRPAAIDQLKILGEQLGIGVFSKDDCREPVVIASEAVDNAIRYGNDFVIIDTAGRLHIDDALMQELENIVAAVHPIETLLVVDAMAGQDALNVAETFNERLTLTGLVLTKMDGDTRGGAALSAKSATGCPVKFVGVGEKTDALEPFYPDRIASRILGMGDVLTLIEKAQENFDLKKAQEMEEKMRKAEFTLEDFLGQMEQMRKMGDLKDLLSMVPGAGKHFKDVQFDEKEISRLQAIIQSMTPEERRRPEIIGSSRKQRIARGSGVQVQSVNRLLSQFDQAKKLMKKMSGMGGGMGLPGVKMPRPPKPKKGKKNKKNNKKQANKNSGFNFMNLFR